MKRYHYLEQWRARYSHFRRYFRHLIQLDFHAEPGSQRLLRALDPVRQLESGERNALPVGVDVPFVPTAWRGRLTAAPQGIDRRTWEIALVVCEALRADELS